MLAQRRPECLDTVAAQPVSLGPSDNQRVSVTKGVEPGQAVVTDGADRLKDGAKVKSPFLVQFGLSGMGVAPAGVEKPATGHHHLLIDTKLTDEQMKAPIPADDTHKHFGAGQTEAMVTLPKGKHTLQLVLADWTHIPHVPPVMSQVITVTVR